MPAKKGTRPPNAGKRGRKPGTPNKVTRTTRELFSAFVDHNAGKAQALFDRVARKNPAMALRILSSFSDFVLPRMQRTEGTLDITKQHTTEYPSFRDLDQVEAARAYQDLLASDRENRQVTFREPEHSEEWYKERDAQRAHEKELAEIAARPPGRPPAPTALARATQPPAPSPPERPIARPRPLKVVDPVDQDSVVLTVEQQEDARLRVLRPERVLT